MHRYKVIINPYSGKGATAKRIPEIEQALNGLGLDYSISLTERPWHAVELVREAIGAEYTVVVAVGGDGTVNEVINGILQCKAEQIGEALLGVLPVGRGNDFAFASGIPLDLSSACQALAKAEVHDQDAGFISDHQSGIERYFGNQVGIGFDAVVGRLANQGKLSGFIGYLVAALKTMYIYYQAPEVQIDLSNEVIRQRSLMVSVMNGRRAGGGFLMAPDGNPRDGQFDICIARNLSKAGILLLIPRFMKGNQAGHPAITFRKDNRVAVQALNGHLPVHVDGEVIDVDVNELLVEILPNHLKVITP